MDDTAKRFEFNSLTFPEPLHPKTEFSLDSDPTRQNWTIVGEKSKAITHTIIAHLGSDAHSTETVFFVVNELLENAIKYSNDTTKITVQLLYNESKISLVIKNISSTVQITQLTQRLEKLSHLIADGQSLNDVFMAQFAKNNSHPVGDGMGILMILKDYPIPLTYSVHNNETQVEILFTKEILHECF